jgi:hypoxanthine phosphoribosyltransferase
MEEKIREQNQYKLGEILINEDEIKNRATEIGKEISHALEGESVLAIGVLKGAVLWMSELIKHITAPVTIDFVAVSSYGAATKSSGDVRSKYDLDRSIEGLNILVVEDIVDTGLTLSYLKKNLLARGPKSLRICTLLNKPARREVDIDIDYVGFTVEDVFVVGYGLDVDQQFRNLPYITSVDIITT